MRGGNGHAMPTTTISTATSRSTPGRRYRRGPPGAALPHDARPVGQADRQCPDFARGLEDDSPASACGRNQDRDRLPHLVMMQDAISIFLSCRLNLAKEMPECTRHGDNGICTFPAIRSRLRWRGRKRHSTVADGDDSQFIRKSRPVIQADRYKA